jgi:hypothetical protein
VANADSVMLQCDGQVNRNTGGDHSSTTGQANSYGCGPSAPASNLTLADHDASIFKCNGGNPKGNNAWLPISLGQQVVVYCVSRPTPTPILTPKPTPTPTPKPSLPVYYVVANADSVMLQCDGQVNRYTGGDHSSTTGQAYSYGCGPSAPASNFTLTDHDGSMIKCNGGNPNGNGAWFPMSLGQQVVVYCVSSATPTPTPIPTPKTTPTPTPTPRPSGQPTPPPLTNPQNPISYGADPTGAADSTGAFASAAAAGDLDVQPGTYLLQTGEITLNNRNVRCETSDAGVVFNQPTLAANLSIFELSGTSTIFNCNFHGPYYNLNGAGYQTYYEDFVHVNPPSNGMQIIGNTFNGSGGYTGAVDIYASSSQQPPATNGVIGWNTFSHCDYYAVQLTSATNYLIENNTNQDCAGYIEADNIGQANTGNIVIGNHLTFTYGTGWANAGAGYWANELTCGQSASGTPFNYSGNNCQNNIVDGTDSSMIAETPAAGGVAAKYVTNTCTGACSVN